MEKVCKAEQPQISEPIVCCDGELAQPFRALVLGKDLSLSTHMLAQIICNSSSTGSDDFLWPPQAYGAYIFMQVKHSCT